MSAKKRITALLKCLHSFVFFDVLQAFRRYVPKAPILSTVIWDRNNVFTFVIGDIPAIPTGNPITAVMVDGPLGRLVEERE